MNTTDLHFEHTQWSSELAFWTDELRSFTNRLEELVNRWTDKDVLAQLEHYQNSFILHGRVIETLQHEINVHETELSENDKRGVDSATEAHTESHLVFRDKMETQREMYAELKKAFFSFLSKTM